MTRITMASTSAGNSLKSVPRDGRRDGQLRAITPIELPVRLAETPSAITSQS